MLVDMNDCNLNLKLHIYINTISIHIQILHAKLLMYLIKVDEVEKATT